MIARAACALVLVSMLLLGGCSANKETDSTPIVLEADAPTLAPREGFYLFEPARTHRVGGLMISDVTMQAVRRVYRDRIEYSVRFGFFGQSWEESENTIRQLVSAYDSCRGKVVPSIDVIVNSWAQVDGTSGTFGFSLLNDEMSVDGHNLGPAQVFIEGARNVLSDIDRLHGIEPATRP